MPNTAYFVSSSDQYRRINVASSMFTKHCLAIEPLQYAVQIGCAS